MLLKKIETFPTFFCNFAELFSAGLQTLHFTCPRQQSEGKTFTFLANSFFLVLRNWRSNFRTFTQTLFVSLVKTAFEVTRETIWSKLISFTKHRKVSPLFGNEWKIFQLVGEKLWNFCRICTRLSQLYFKETFYLKFE